MRHKVVSENGNWSTVYTDGDPERTGIAIRYITSAYPDEPLFCVRGRDRLAVPAANAYRMLAAGALAPIAGGGLVIAAVETDIAVIAEWQRANPDLLKYPDR